MPRGQLLWRSINFCYDWESFGWAKVETLEDADKGWDMGKVGVDGSSRRRFDQIEGRVTCS